MVEEVELGQTGLAVVILNDHDCKMTENLHRLE